MKERRMTMLVVVVVVGLFSSASSTSPSLSRTSSRPGDCRRDASESMHGPYLNRSYIAAQSSHSPPMSAMNPLNMYVFFFLLGLH